MGTPAETHRTKSFGTMSVSSVYAKECDNAHDGERWYAVQTRQYAEKRAQAQLEQQNFRTFLPKRRKTIRHARKLSTVTAAFFPGYLFVLLDLNRDRWRSVNGTFGISTLVMAGELPCPVPAGVVANMCGLAHAAGLLQPSAHLKERPPG